MTTPKIEGAHAALTTTGCIVITPERFKKCSMIDVSAHTEEKGGFTYLKWAAAVAVAREEFGEIEFKIETSIEGSPLIKGENGCWVKVSMKLPGSDIVHTTMYPILDEANTPIKAERVNCFDINTSLQRARVKLIAEVTGIGLYIYAGQKNPIEFTVSEKSNEKVKKQVDEILQHSYFQTDIKGVEMRSKLIRKYSSISPVAAIKAMQEDLPKLLGILEKVERKEEANG